MRFNSRLLAVAAACAGSTLAYADSNSSPGTDEIRALSMTDVIQLALEHSIDIQIQRYAVKVADYSFRGSYGSWDPNYTLGGSHFYSVQGGGVNAQNQPLPPGRIENNGLSTGISGTSPFGTTYSVTSGLSEQYGSAPKVSSYSLGLASISQPLLKNLWTDQNRLTIWVGKNRLKYSEAALRQQIISTVTQVKQAYYDLIADEENVKVNEEARDLAQKLVDDNKKKVALGTLAPLDEKQSESQLAQNIATLLVAQETLVEQRNLVKNLITDTYAKWVKTVIRPTEHLLAVPEATDLQESWRAAMSKRPDLQQAKLDIERMGLQVTYDKNQVYPDVEVFGGYTINGTATYPYNQFNDAFDHFANGQYPTYRFGASLSIPLGNRAAVNQWRADKASKAQLGLTLKKLEQSAMVSVANDVKKIESTLEQVQATREAREYAELALQAEQKKLDTGSSTVFVVLQLQSNLTSARFSEIQALANYNKTVVQLDADEGSTIEKNRINIESH